jgi:hypothetical protein
MAVSADHLDENEMIAEWPDKDQTPCTDVKTSSQRASSNTLVDNPVKRNLFRFLTRMLDFKQWSQG